MHDRARPTSPSRAQPPLAAWRKAKAVELAVEGHTYDTIAEQVGFANRGTAHRVVRKALDEQVAENVQQLRETELARLDALQAALWPAAMAGHLDAAQQVADIIDKQARLLGLYPTGRHKPEKPLEPVTVIVPEGWTYNEQRRQWDVTPEALSGTGNLRATADDRSRGAHAQDPVRPLQTIKLVVRWSGQGEELLVQWFLRGQWGLGRPPQGVP